ncbi:uncharacterized protein LOC134459340 isoform X2 [Engraulis encrasicolus]
MTERAEVTIALDGQQLRDQWETRSNELKEKGDLERSRVKKSALNGLFQEWNFRLAQRQGVTGEKKGKDMSDFRKIVITPPEVEQDEKALQAKFKVARPPPRKVAPPPPPPPKREPKPPPPNRERAPQPKPEEKKPAARTPQPGRAPQPAPSAAGAPAVTKKVAYKDNLSQAGWDQSWKILKPLMDMEMAMGAGKKEAKGGKFDAHKYRCVQRSLEETWSASAEWNKSSPLPKNEVQKHHPKSQKPMKSVQQPESFSANDWAESWKSQNPVFQQQEEAWGQEWSGYCVHPKDKTSNAECKGENPQGWEESFKSFKYEPKKEEEHVESEDYWKKKELRLYKKGLFCPGWSESWKSPEMKNGPSKVTQNGNNHSAIVEVYLRDWAESWKACRNHSWSKESSLQRYRIYFHMMSKRIMLNNVRSFQLEEQVPTAEWTESWKVAKGQTQAKDTHEVSAAQEVDISQVPLQLQFHMLNTKFPGWAKSWSVAKPPSGGDGAAQPSPQWKNSWKLSNPNPSAGDGTKASQDVACWSDEHKNYRYIQSDVEEYVTPSEWSECWQTVKPPPKAEAKPEPTEGESILHSHNHVHIGQYPLLDWTDSWKFTSKRTKSYTVSLSRWGDSWKFSNPNDEHMLQGEKQVHKLRVKGHRYPESAAKEPEVAEWATSWKHMTPDSPKPDAPREDSGEWGECWRLSNPQLFLKKEAWSEQEHSEEHQDLTLQLSFMAKGDKKVFNPEFSQPEWNESWRFMKQQAEHRRE